MTPSCKSPSRRWFFMVGLCACGMALAGPQIGAWDMRQSRNPDNNRVILFRYAKSFSGTFERSALPYRVIVVWRYESPNGMPSPDLRQRMDLLEDRMSGLIDAPGESVLVLVSTGENLREWIFYVQSKERFLGQLEPLVKREPGAALEVHAAEDRGWTTYQRFLDWSQKR